MHRVAAMERSDEPARRALLVMLLGALALVLVVLRPLGSAIFLAAVLAMVLWPVHEWLSRRFRGRRSLAAVVVVTLFGLAIVGPLAWLSALVVGETIGAVRFIADTVKSDGVHGLVAALPQPLSDAATYLLARVELDSADVSHAIQQRVGAAGGSAAVALGAAISATGSLLFQGAMMVIALFLFLTQKDAVVHWLDDASPLRRGQTRELGAEFVRVCKSVIVSTAATALVQAIAALVGYLIAKVPHPMFFFALTFVIAFIPAAGAASACLAAAALVLATGHPWAALFLAIWGIVVVGLVDNVVKPLLMKDGIRMHGAVVLFALLGGLAAFGAMGLLIGPLAVALFLAMLRMYKRDYSTDPDQRRALREQSVGSHDGPSSRVPPDAPAHA